MSEHVLNLRRLADAAAVRVVVALLLIMSVAQPAGADNRDVLPWPSDWSATEGRDHPLAGKIWSHAAGKLVTVSEATVKVFINGDKEPLWSVAEGNGPVNALDGALRKDLGRYQRNIDNVELVDYKVRILTGGTEAVTRVLVESHDRATGARWMTVGVSPNIVDASFEALLDSINYKLLKDGATLAH